MSMEQKDHQGTDSNGSLSALLDGEISELELRRLLREARDNPELLESWERYNFARSVLHGEPLRRAGPSLGQRVARQVANEPSPGRGTAAPTRVRGWLAPAGRLAVAASVTLAVFLGMQVLLPGGPDAPGPVSGNRQASSDTVVDPEAQQRLNEYIQSVSIPHPDEQGNREDLANINTLLESTRLRPVSDRELLRTDEDPETAD